MEYRTFRKWLAEHECRFDAQSEKREEGHGTVTIHRAGGPRLRPHFETAGAMSAIGT
jgi:hypothetical protein